MQIGFLVPNLGASQLAFRLMYNINEVCKTDLKKDIVVFYENQLPPSYTIGFATMNAVDAWNYPGNLISTTLTTTHKAMKFPGPKNKYFYVMDLEWIRIPYKRYESLAEIYQSPDIKLLARSHEHAERLEEAWSRPVRAVIEDFNMNDIATVISEDESHAEANKKILR